MAPAKLQRDGKVMVMEDVNAMIKAIMNQARNLVKNVIELVEGVMDLNQMIVKTALILRVGFFLVNVIV